jgi:hypothetical protein
MERPGQRLGSNVEIKDVLRGAPLKPTDQNYSNHHGAAELIAPGPDGWQRTASLFVRPNDRAEKP